MRFGSFLQFNIEEIKILAAERIPRASSQQLTTMIEQYGRDLAKVFDQAPTDCIASLMRCKGIGPKTAEKLKAQWDATAPIEERQGSMEIGLRIVDLEASPPAAPQGWGPDTRCYLRHLHAAEVAIAESAGAKMALSKPPESARLARIRKWINANQDSSGVDFSLGQCAAIEAASDAPLLVITGGPGCGKTTVVQAIVKLWCAQGKDVHICAPTGRAAQRMGAIQNIEPSTIHRLLRYQVRGAAANTDVSGDCDNGGVDGDRDAGFFEHGPRNPLPSDAVLVDEASMLNLPLAAALMQALRPKTQLILVGDVDQLPPVGPGGVLHSLIASGLAPVIDLREIFRQAATSAIITSAISVRQGAVPRLRDAQPTTSGLLSAGTDALLVRAPAPEDVAGLVYASVAALAQAKGFSEADLQVITPMRKGPTGTGILNLHLQELLNPPTPAKSEVHRSNGSEGGGVLYNVFRIGDRVLQRVNNYDKDVFNGDQGRIIAVDPQQRRVSVKFPKVSGPIDADNEIIRDYQGMELSQLELAYAVTVHKAQGGEARHVVLAMSPQHGRLLTRRLLYTGLTRARELLVVVAPGGAVDPIVTAVGRQESEARLSSLKTRLESEAIARGLEPQSPVVFSNEDDVFGGMIAGIASSLEDNAIDIGETRAVEFPSISEPASLGALCEELGVNADTAAHLASLFGGEFRTTLMSSDIVRSHLSALQTVLDTSLDISTVLRTAPRLLVASPEYFERSLDFCQRLGPSDHRHTHAIYSLEEESLVDQLRRLLVLI